MTAVAAVAIVDDHDVFAEALCAALGVDGVLATSVAVDDGPGSLVGRVLASGVSVALVDIDLRGGRSGIDLVAPLTGAGLRVVVLTGLLGEGAARAALDAGAVAVLDKAGSFRRVREVVREQLGIDAGRGWGLTRSEAAVLGDLLAGRAASEIAAARGVALTTVRSHIRSVLSKLGVRTQLAAVARARAAGWTPPD